MFILVNGCLTCRLELGAGIHDHDLDQDQRDSAHLFTGVYNLLITSHTPSHGELGIGVVDLIFQKFEYILNVGSCGRGRHNLLDEAKRS